MKTNPKITSALPMLPRHQFNTSTLQHHDSRSRWLLCPGFLYIVFALVVGSFTLLRTARAVSPPPDGGYPGGNTAEGDFALFSADVEAGNEKTAIGFSTLYSNVGSFNTAIGSEALYSNTASHHNTATGSFALHTNTIGNENTATGASALLHNTTGNDNTATGVAALQSNTTGDSNTATGVAALALNTTGNNNTANGDGALFDNTTGVNNAANGVQALQSNTTGSFNTANGYQALFSNTTGSRNIALGSSAGSSLITGNNNIDIGNAGFAGDARTIRIGVGGIHTRTFVAGVNGSPITGTSVVVNGSGRLGTVASSQRFKDDIKPMDKASEAILALKPVTFHYKKEVDPDGIPQFGLVAEDVEKINPDLVARDPDGKPYTVRYEAVNAMLLNEFLKEHRKVEEQEKTIVELKSGMTALAATVKEQAAAQIQKVSAQIEMSKPAPRTVLNNQ